MANDINFFPSLGPGGSSALSSVASGAGGAAGGLSSAFLPLLILQGIFGATQGGAGAFNEATAQANQAAQAAISRSRILKLIESLENPDFSGVEAMANKNFSRAADSIDASTAARGTFRAGAGGARAMQSDALGDVLAALSQFEAQQQSQNAQTIGGLLMNPAFGVPKETIDPTLASLLGFLGGAAGGAGGFLGKFAQTESGLDSLGKLFGGQ